MPCFPSRCQTWSCPRHWWLDLPNRCHCFCCSCCFWIRCFRCCCCFHCFCCFHCCCSCCSRLESESLSDPILVGSSSSHERASTTPEVSMSLLVLLCWDLPIFYTIEGLETSNLQEINGAVLLLAISFEGVGSRQSHSC